MLGKSKFIKIGIILAIILIFINFYGIYIIRSVLLYADSHINPYSYSGYINVKNIVRLMSPMEVSVGRKTTELIRNAIASPGTPSEIEKKYKRNSQRYVYTYFSPSLEKSAKRIDCKVKVRLVSAKIQDERCTVWATYYDEIYAEDDLCAGDGNYFDPIPIEVHLKRKNSEWIINKVIEAP